MLRLPVEEAQQSVRGNRRAAVRYRCAPATTGKLCLENEQELERAWVINISKKGLGMVVPRALPKDAYLVLQMRSGNGLIDLPVQVVHATRHNQTEWIVGCELIDPLDDDELEALL